MKDSLSIEVATLGDDDAVRDVLAEICALTGMGFSAVAHVTDQRWIACQVEDRISFGLEPGEELEVRKTICDDIRTNGKPILIDDTDADRDWWNHPVPLLYGFHSYVSLPLRLADGSFFGTLCALDPQPRSGHLADRLGQLEALGERLTLILSAKIAASPVGSHLPALGSPITVPEGDSRG